jgi:hypothetical protein
VKLHFIAGDEGETGTLLHLPNSLAVAYADIVAMGDLYGLPDAPISRGKTPKEREERFHDAFDTLARKYTSVYEAAQLIDVAHAELKAVTQGMENGEKAEVIYRRIGNEIGRQMNCITGGGCSPSTWWLEPGRYLNLTSANFDHFNDNAWTTYTAGHQAALAEAAAAHQHGDRKRLEFAYAINAFACHFLSDRFSSGHIRTPRDELTARVTPQLAGSLLAKFMHNEESASGLHVHNARGDHWVAYGDESYFNPENKTSRAILDEALQASADSIFQAYLQGRIAIDDPIEQLIPIADEIGDLSKNDISPLFYWDAKTEKLMRREDMKNVYDRHWTSSWWGWSTLAELQRERGLDFLAQAELARSPLREKAIQDGLITDKRILASKEVAL